MSFKFNGSKLLSSLQYIEDRTVMGVRMLAETGALNMEKDAKEQARWTDRTGHARQRLKGSVQLREFGFRVQLAHGVDYGLWLELANEKRFAIVEPIVRFSSPYIMQDFEKLMEKLS